MKVKAEIILFVFLLSFTTGCGTAFKSRCERASEYMLKGKKGLAMEEYIKAIAEDSMNVRANYELAFIYCEQKEWQEAIPFLERTARLEPNYLTTNELIARAYFRTNRLQNEGLGVFPSSVDTTEVNLVYTVGEEFFLQGYFKRAREYLERIPTEINVEYLDLYLSAVYSSEGNYLKAIDLLKRFFETKPRCVERINLSLLYEKVDSTNRAKQEFNRVIALTDTFYYGHPRRPNHYLKGYVYYIKGNYSAALREWKITKKQHSNWAVSYHNLCILYQLTNNCEQWRRELNTAEKRYPQEPFELIDKGLRRLAEEDYNSALTNFQCGHQKWKFSTVFHIYVAYTLEKLGRSEEANHFWNLCVFQVPGGVSLQDAKVFGKEFVQDGVRCVK